MPLLILPAGDGERRRASLCVDKLSIDELAEASRRAYPEHAGAVLKQKLNVIARQTLRTRESLVDPSVAKLIETGIGANPQVAVHIFRKRVNVVATESL